MLGRLEIFDDPPALARHVAEWLTGAALGTAGPFRVALAGGSTPAALYALLAEEAFRRRFPWHRSHWFWGDERLVSHDHPASNYRMVFQTLLSKVPAPEQNIHPVPIGTTPEAAALSYERALQEVYGTTTLDPNRPLFDVVLLGLGADGHTASLLPDQPVLEERRRWVAAVPRGRPEVRITMTYPALESSRRVAFLVAGAAKAAIFGSIRDGASLVPAARLRPRGETIWFVDRAAAGPDGSPDAG